MKRIAVSLVSLAAMLASAAEARGESASERERIPGEVVVQFRGAAGPDEKADARTAVGAEVAERAPLGPGLQLLELDADTAVGDAIEALERRPDVAYAEPNLIRETAAIPDDELFATQLWGMDNSGQTIGGSVGTPDADIDAPEAWDTETGSGSVTVAVIDTGIDFTHPDLDDNLWSNPGETGDGRETNGVDDDGNGYVDDTRGWDFGANDNDPRAQRYYERGRDAGSHGTHVAGTIGAEGDNGIGVAGVGWDAGLMSLRVFDENLTSWRAAEAYRYAAANGADVANGSYGGGGFSQVEHDALEESSDTLFVFAAGNNGSNNDSRTYYPCGYDVPNVLCVAATNNRDRLASFSNYGAAQVDLAAPGVDIASARASYLGGGYEYKSGTSMATPMVAGAAAVLLARDPTATVGEIRTALLAGTDRLSSLEGWIATEGRLNLDRSIDALDEGAELAPLNDDFARPRELTGYRVARNSDSNVGASKQPGEPDHAGPGGRSVWYRWQAPYTNTVRIDTAGSGFDTTLAAYTGDSVDALTPVAANDDSSDTDQTSRVSFEATRGTVYRIAVDGADGAEGRVALHLDQAIPRPANDSFSTPFALDGAVDARRGDTNLDATRETGEPSLGFGRSIWYSWQAPKSGYVSVDTRGSAYDTVIAAYTGSSVDTLSRIAYGDDDGSSPQSRMNFTAEAGTTYRIAVDDFSRGGPISVALSLTDEPPDTTAPDTEIISGPADGARIDDPTPTFGFESGEAGSRFECSVDSGAYQDCVSPHTTGALNDGQHRFRVRAIDVAGNVDPSPASRSFTVYTSAEPPDTTPPETVLESQFSSGETIRNRRPTFGFWSTETGSRFECSVDRAEFTGCTAPHSVAALDDGAHDFRVRAIDGAGNADQTPAETNFRVDATAPETTITSAPEREAINFRNPSFGFESSEAGSRFLCEIDRGGYAPCDSPLEMRDLSEGIHSLEVKAVDQAGNEDLSPARRGFVVDTTAPETIIHASHAEGASIRDQSPGFWFETSDIGSTYECSLNGAAFSACNDPARYFMLADGPYTLRARATDRAGNVDPTPASWSFRVDTDPPETTIAAAPKRLVRTAKPRRPVGFALESDERDVTFECRITGRGWHDCPANPSYGVNSGTEPVSYVFAARAVDAAGNVGWPVRYRFSVARK